MVRACLRVFVRACVRAFMRACVRARVHAFMHACVRACARAFMHAFVCVCVCMCVRACVCACVRACVRVCVRACVRMYVRAWVYKMMCADLCAYILLSLHGNKWMLQNGSWQHVHATHMHKHKLTHPQTNHTTLCRLGPGKIQRGDMIHQIGMVRCESVYAVDSLYVTKVCVLSGVSLRVNWFIYVYFADMDAPCRVWVSHVSVTFGCHIFELHTLWRYTLGCNGHVTRVSKYIADEWVTLQTWLSHVSILCCLLGCDSGGGGRNFSRVKLLVAKWIGTRIRLFSDFFVTHMDASCFDLCCVWGGYA